GIYEPDPIEIEVRRLSQQCQGLRLRAEEVADDDVLALAESGDNLARGRHLAAGGRLQGGEEEAGKGSWPDWALMPGASLAGRGHGFPHRFEIEAVADRQVVEALGNAPGGGGRLPLELGFAEIAGERLGGAEVVLELTLEIRQVFLQTGSQRIRCGGHEQRFPPTPPDGSRPSPGPAGCGRS